MGWSLLAMSTSLRRLALLVVGFFAVGAIAACSSVTASTRPTQSLSVRELNIVDEHGQAASALARRYPIPRASSAR